MFEAVFELADTWCPNIDEYEYQGFFKALENKLKYGGQQDGAAYSIMPWVETVLAHAVKLVIKAKIKFILLTNDKLFHSRQGIFL